MMATIIPAHRPLCSLTSLLLPWRISVHLLPLILGWLFYLLWIAESGEIDSMRVLSLILKKPEHAATIMRRILCLPSGYRSVSCEPALTTRHENKTILDCRAPVQLPDDSCHVRDLRWDQGKSWGQIKQSMF